MSRHCLSLILLLTAIPPLMAASGPADPPPVAVFRELEGTWKGTFVGHDARGEELYRIEATHTYRRVDDHTQEATIEDRMSDGTVIKSTGRNLARRNDRGELEISCDLEKSNGERVRHQGRLVRGPLGTTEFIWYSAAGDRSETFRESVVDDRGTPVYQVDGMGRYGDKLVLMAGRYRKVSR